MRLTQNKIMIVFVLFLTALSMYHCSKKSEWTTDSQEALTAFLQARDYHNAFNSKKALELYKKAFEADTNFATVALMLEIGRA